MKVQKLGE
jgi:negative regulator of replication initiation